MIHLVSLDSQVQLSPRAPNDQCPPIILMLSLPGSIPNPPPPHTHTPASPPVFHVALWEPDKTWFSTANKALKHHVISHELFERFIDLYKLLHLPTEDVTRTSIRTET